MANPPKRESDLSKLVSAARALLTNQIGFPLGCYRIWRILGWIDDSSIYYPVFTAYISATDALPVGQERLLCERNAFFRFDEMLEAVNREYRSRVLEACFDILDRFATANPNEAL